MSKDIHNKRKLRTLVRQAEKSELASLGSVVHKIMSITDCEDFTSTNLKEIIELDPPLCSKVLRRANSASYGIPRNVTSVLEAIIFMGFNNIRELTLSIKVAEFFNDSTVTGNYSKKALWDHSVAVAMCAKKIYRRIFKEKGDTIYSAGLLHELGMIVEDQYDHKSFKEIVYKAWYEGRPLLEVENETQGYNHCTIARRLTTAWKLPQEIIEAVSWHHAPLSAPEAYTKQAYTLFIAEYLCSRNSIGYTDIFDEQESVFDQCCRTLGIKQLALEIILEDTIKELNERDGKVLVNG